MTGPGLTPRRGKSGALAAIVLCLVASALLRLGIQQAAIAEEIAMLSEPGAAEASRPAVAASCPRPEAPAALLQAIRERQAQLDVKEVKIEDRLQALRIAEAKLKENTAALVEAERKLAATLAIADEAAEKDLQRLTSVYENMKPKNAAGLFGEMAPEFAAGFIARMRPDAAAQIMSSLESGKAYAISVVMAGRNALAPGK